MRSLGRVWIPLAIVAVFAACEAEVEEPGRLPDIDASGGEMPNVDLDPADVEISTDTQVVEVPDVDVESQEP